MNAVDRNPTKWLLALGALVGLVVVCPQFFRQLNLDEALVLRAGWLSLEGFDAKPAFWMPWTAILGILSHLPIPTWLLWLSIRCFTAALLGLSYLYAIRQFSQHGLWLYLALLLSGPYVLVHGFEFRYDAAILIGIFTTLGLISSKHRYRFIGIGSCIAWIGLHHLKGVYFAAALLGIFSLYRIKDAFLVKATPIRLVFLQLFSSILGFTALWLCITLSLGRQHEFIELYRGFFNLSQHTYPVHFQFLVESLKRYPLHLALGLIMIFRACMLRHQTSETAQSFLLMALTATIFPFLHPHPWAYMGIPIAALIAPLIGEFILSLPKSWSRSVTISFLILWLATPWRGVFGEIRYSMKHNFLLEAHFVDWLRDDSNKELKIFDPTGIVYSAKPCLQEWYYDSIFEYWFQNGQWLKGLDSTINSCDAIVRSWRTEQLLGAAYFNQSVQFTRSENTPLYVSNSAKKDLRQFSKTVPNQIRNYHGVYPIKWNKLPPKTPPQQSSH